MQGIFEDTAAKFMKCKLVCYQLKQHRRCEGRAKSKSRKPNPLGIGRDPRRE